MKSHVRVHYVGHNHPFPSSNPLMKTQKSRHYTTLHDTILHCVARGHLNLERWVKRPKSPGPIIEFTMCEQRDSATTTARNSHVSHSSTCMQKHSACCAYLKYICGVLFIFGLLLGLPIMVQTKCPRCPLMMFETLKELTPVL